MSNEGAPLNKRRWKIIAGYVHLPQVHICSVYRGGLEVQRVTAADLVATIERYDERLHEHRATAARFLEEMAREAFSDDGQRVVSAYRRWLLNNREEEDA